MSIAEDMLLFSQKMKDLKEEIQQQYDRNVKDACYLMIETAKESTPPQPGGKRGTNTWTGELRSHWDFDVSRVGNKFDYRITLKNDKQYASYVNDGHRMAKHFVPWLYIDDTGVISKHLPVPGEGLFGLVVGTKTKNVPPADMTGKAQERFFDALTRMNEEIFLKVGKHD